MEALSELEALKKNESVKARENQLDIKARSRASYKALRRYFGRPRFSFFLKLSSYAYLVILMTILLIWYPAAGVTRENLWSLPVSSKLFEAPWVHVVKQFANDPTVTQKDRQDSLTRLVDAAFSAYNSIGLKAFIDSGTLLGYVREGGLIPWDEDADVGFDVDDCQKLFPRPGDFQRAMEENLDPTRFLIVGADCQGTDRQQLGHLLFAGKVIDITTGFYVDQFAYKLHKAGEYSGKYIRTQLDRGLIYERDVIQPLVKVTFLGNPNVHVPHDAVKFLNIQFSENLSTPPEWDAVLGYSTSHLSWFAIALLAILSIDFLYALICGYIFIKFSGALQINLLILSTIACSIGVSHKRILFIGFLTGVFLLCDYSNLFWRYGLQLPILNWHGKLNLRWTDIGI